MMKIFRAISLILFFTSYYYITVIGSKCNDNNKCGKQVRSIAGCIGSIFGVSECFEPICIEGCSECTNSKECKVCNPNMYLKFDTKSCINEIVDNYYLDSNENNVLKPCHTNCVKCSSDKNENCIQCKVDYYLVEDTGSCINKTIDNYYLDNNILRKCHPNCVKCSSNENLNCEQCQVGYYLTEDTQSCYQNGVNDYYLDNNILRNCHPNCVKCINNQNKDCIQCQTNYYMTEDTQSCYNEIIDNYYLENNILRPCHPNCVKCSGNQNVNCSQCQTNYYLTEDTQSCYQNGIDNYYLDNNILKRCHENCKTCINSPNDSDMNCISCREEFYILNGTNNCYTLNSEKTKVINSISESISNGNILRSEYLTNLEYINLNKDITWKDKITTGNPEETIITKMDSSSKIMDNKFDIDGNTSNIEESNLKEENNTLNIDNISTKINQTTDDIDRTISNIEINISKENQTDYESNLLLTEKGNVIKGCPANLFLTLTGDCKSDCPNGTYLFSQNQTCLESCPHNYKINEVNKVCILNTFDQKTSLNEFKSQISDNIFELINSDKVVNGSDFIAVISLSEDIDPIEQIRKGISAVDLGNCPKVLKEYYNISNNESLIVVNIESKKSITKENEENNDNSLNIGKNNQVEIYDFSGRKLDLSVCKENIKIMKYIGDVVEELDINSAMSLSKQGIDIFNANDSFFNDLCHKYDNVDGKDIIINDRRKDIYQNVTFCQYGCVYNGMDYELMIANCICGSSSLQNEKNITEDKKIDSETLNFKSITKSFISNLLDFNIDVIYCYNLVFNFKALIKNIGFICLFIMFILQLIFFFIYLIKKLKPIRNFMYVFKISKNLNGNRVSLPPKKSNLNKKNKDSEQTKEKRKNKFFSINNKNKNNIKKNNESKNENSKRKLNLINDNSLQGQNSINMDNIFSNKLNKINEEIKKMKVNSLFKSGLVTEQNLIKKNVEDKKKNIIFTNNFSPTINIQTPILNINHTGESSTFRNLDKNINNNKKLGNKIIKNKATLNNVETIGDDQRNNKTINKLSNSDEDIQDMDYEEAIIKDKRSYLRMFWSFLIDSQIILGTFCTENYLNLFVIKLSFFVCTFQISFFLNALFYTDDYISDAYHNEGVLDFISGLPKAIYSFLATLITTNLLKMLSNSKSELIKAIREKSQELRYINIVNAKLIKLRKKLIAYFILVFLFGIIFLYYVSSFCAVYRYSQKYWFIGCLESFAIDSGVAILICILLAFLRYLAIKNRIKYLFKLANIISTIL